MEYLRAIISATIDLPDEVRESDNYWRRFDQNGNTDITGYHSFNTLTHILSDSFTESGI